MPLYKGYVHSCLEVIAIGKLSRPVNLKNFLNSSLFRMYQTPPCVSFYKVHLNKRLNVTLLLQNLKIEGIILKCISRISFSCFSDALNFCFPSQLPLQIKPLEIKQCTHILCPCQQQVSPACSASLLRCLLLRRTKILSLAGDEDCRCCKSRGETRSLRWSQFLL